mgnify:CR=1 FL=1
MAGPLLTTKLHVPPTAPNLVARPRLLALLDEDCAQHRVTLIAAPAGYGKTTLVAQWITARCLGQGETEPCSAHPHVVWYALDEEENNATRFLTYLTVALQHAALDACPVALAALQSAEELDETAVLALLLNEIDNRHDSVIVVLDDYWKI